MIEAFIVRAWLASVLMAALAGPIGCVMIWRKTAYFSDTLSHSALAGIVLGAALSINPNFTVACLVCFLALLLIKIPEKTIVGIDLYLLIIGQTALCSGLIGLSYLSNFRSDLTGYLFGDVLSVTFSDLIFMALIGLFCAIILYKNWNKQIFCAVAPDIAQCEGISIIKQNRIFTLILALFIAIAFKTTGLLLVSALLIIPAAAARFISNTPEEMAIKSIFIGLLSTTAGIISSFFFDSPTAPSIELFCAISFTCLLFFRSCHKKEI